MKHFDITKEVVTDTSKDQANYLFSKIKNKNIKKNKTKLKIKKQIKFLNITTTKGENNE